LGILWIIYGTIRLVMSFVLVVFSPTATVMFGALLTRVADPFTLMSEFHIWYTCAIVLSVLCGIFGFVEGTKHPSRRSGGVTEAAPAFMQVRSA
jgi:hypothetical protein